MRRPRGCLIGLGLGLGLGIGLGLVVGLRIGLGLGLGLVTDTAYVTMYEKNMQPVLLVTGTRVNVNAASWASYTGCTGLEFVTCAAGHARETIDGH